MKKYYHYTPTSRIEAILASKKINQAICGIQKNEKPVTWISSNQFWENTATKKVCTPQGEVRLTFAQQVEYCGCSRIQVKPNNLIPWKSLKHQAKIHPKIAAKLVEIGEKWGANPEEWYGSLSPIEIDQWIQIEEYINGKWIVVHKF